MQRCTYGISVQTSFIVVHLTSARSLIILVLSWREQTDRKKGRAKAFKLDG